LDAAEAAKLVSCLFDSRLYRSDQRSFMLYPERELPNFLDKNVIPGEKMDAIPLLQELIKEGKGSIVDRDAFGTYRFHADFLMQLDSLNPQVAARLLTPLTQWRRYDVLRQERMRAELQRILDSGKCSKDVYEVVSKSLA
ncbi:MAG: aminopeptidase N C-terminal domain-containing protein, partial [Gammaproteobacteria bacterium]|nr:aminopeptidase N C-terminal domain-containing protein [Gammaproteobacteria bacterium]